MAATTRPLKVHPCACPRREDAEAPRSVGGSKGKTAGRGTKGAKARGQVPARVEGGQTACTCACPSCAASPPFRVEYQVVNLDKLSALYPDGGDVTVDDLVARGAVRKGQPVKVLGTGDIAVAVTVTVHAASASAREDHRGGGQRQPDLVTHRRL